MIKIIAVGGIKEDYIQEAISLNKHRIEKKMPIEVIVIDDEHCPETLSEKEKSEVKRKEGQRIAKHIRQQDYVIALTLEGKPFQEKRFEKIANNENCCFIIGGSLGLSDEVKKLAKEELSFGPMTYPHQLVRWILLEKIADVVR